MANVVQVWNPDEWETFALGLLQSRHGALNIHKIPAAHQGDFGIDYYCSKEAVVYQCYAVQEPIDVDTRSKRQKKKITTDTGKLILNANEVSKLFLGAPVKHWVLLAPTHDSKDVNIHCSNKTAEIRAKKYTHLDADFEVCIQDPASFAPAAVATGMASLAVVRLNVPTPTHDEMSTWQAGSPNLIANATHKLAKRSPPAGVQNNVSDAVKFFLQCNATLDALRSSAPDLHEKIVGAVAAKYKRLNFAGPEGSSAPQTILHTQIDSLVAAIKAAAPTLSDENADQIAYGSICEWIMSCSLDFPSNAVI